MDRPLCPECERETSFNPNQLYVHSLVSSKDGRGKIHLAWNKERAQLEPDELRKHAAGLFQAAEAAELDSAIVEFFVSKLNFGFTRASEVLGQLRLYRQEHE